MSENRPFYGKDGGKYRDYYEKEAADNRYDQQQKIIEETTKLPITSDSILLIVALGIIILMMIFVSCIFPIT